MLSAKLKELGATVVDADLISRQVSQKGGAAYAEIVDAFGEGILNEVGEINRQELGKIVFSDRQKLELLEEITHKHILRTMQDEVEECKTPVVILDVPLLFQCDFPIKCDLTVAVIADREVRISRIMERDGVSREMALARIKNQIADDDFMVLADMVFENNGDIKKMEEFANNLIG